MFFKVNLWPNLAFFSIFGHHIFKTVLSQFLMLSELSSKMEHQKVIENRTPVKKQCYISFKKLFFSSNWIYGHSKSFFFILRPHFQNSFFLKFFSNFFCAKVKYNTLKSYWKPNISVLLSASWILQIFIHFGAFLLLCGLISITFCYFFHEFRSMSGKMWFIWWFWLFLLSKYLILREFCKRTHCCPIVTLALLLFLTLTKLLDVYINI